MSLNKHRYSILSEFLVGVQPADIFVVWFEEPFCRQNATNRLNVLIGTVSLNVSGCIEVACVVCGSCSQEVCS
jgi:hypothetical protein